MFEHRVLVSADSRCFGKRYASGYLSNETHEWLVTHVGELDNHQGQWDFEWYDREKTTVVFHFRDPRMATLFKLTWGGQ